MTEEEQDQAPIEEPKASEPAETAPEEKPAEKAPAAKKKAAATMERRTFSISLALGWVAFVAACTQALAMIGRFMFPNVLFEPAQTFKAGAPEEYMIGEVSERWKEGYGVWIVRTNEQIYALRAVCTHLGCTPNWLPNEQKFKCPCHGSGFYKTGINFEGPAPRPLERFRVSVDIEGQIVVDKTKTFQQEKGQWDDPESFLVA